jgi:hypothetical protein
MTGTGVNDSGTFRERSLRLQRPGMLNAIRRITSRGCLGRERRMNSMRSETGEGSFKGDVLQNEAS